MKWSKREDESRREVFTHGDARKLRGRQVSKRRPRCPWPRCKQPAGWTCGACGRVTCAHHCGAKRPDGYATCVSCSCKGGPGWSVPYDKRAQGSRSQ